jgi:tRNA(fMet)-specific endonuclease VapC
MIGNKFLLDTNIISALLKGEAVIADNIDKADKVYIPIIVVGELYYGASFSTHVKKNIEDIKKITSWYEVISLDKKTTAIYGDIKGLLRKKGRPIPENDIWIAAIAIQYGLVLITRDRHFNEIEGIEITKW